MHACQNLPPNLAEACTVVSSCLPSFDVSVDAHETAADGGGNVREEDVAPGQLDVALPPDSSGGVMEVWSAPLSGKREELDRCTSDEEFLAWAKAAKRFRPGA